MRFAAALLPVFLLTSTFAPAAGSRDGGTPLDALLARARAASGEPYRYHIVSLAYASSRGRSFEVTTEMDGSKYRMRSCWKSICSGSYFDGERNYDANLNDTALPVGRPVDALQLTLRAIFSYAFAAPDFRARGGELRERKAVVRAGRTLRRISVAPLRGASLDALVDPNTGLVASIASSERGFELDLADERKVGGTLRLPYLVTQNGRAIERFERRSIAPARLEPPAGLVPAFAPSPMPLPLTKFARASDQPVVPCAIGGQAVSCLLDTGNSGLAISLELAEKLGLEPRGGAFGISGIGNYLTGIVAAPQLTVGPATYPAATYAVLHDLEQYGYDIVLGADVFAHARVTIDYPKRTVSFAAESSFASQAGIAVSFENFIPVTSVRIGEQSVALAVDTGDESAIDVAYDYYQLHPDLFKPRGATSVAGIGGTSAQITGELPYVRIGDYEVDRPTIGATRGLSPTANGHIGSGLLEHFAVTFDYASGRIELRPKGGDARVHAATP